MRKEIFLLVIKLFLALPLFSQTFVTNVTVVDVDKQKLLLEQTVAITGNKITGIGSSKKLRPLENAIIIDGKGKFILPGLVDAHVHFFQNGGLYTRPDVIDLRKYVPYEKEIAWVHNNMEDALRRYLKAGITTVIDVGATLNFLQQRDTFQNKSYAPTVYMTGPLITTWGPPVYKNLNNDEPFYEVATPEQARRMVQKQLPFKPDFIKIWYIVPRVDSIEATARKFLPLIQSTIEEAHKNNLKVAVHATQRITAQLAVESGCDYLVHFIDDEIVSDDFLELLRRKKVVLCPSLIVMGGYPKTFAQQRNLTYLDFIKANPISLGSLYDLKHLPDTGIANRYKRLGEQRQSLNETRDSMRRLNLIRMVKAGIVIATGTDAGNIGTLHASSYIEELKAMQQSGMSNWQILQASTINGAKVLGKEKEFGSIAIGKKADMILLNANPLDDLDNLQQLELVINKGQVIKPDTLLKETAVALVQRQLNAYNARNIEGFLEPYADDAELYRFPDKPIGKGKEDMRKRYSSMFERTPDLHCEITSRMMQGNVIIDHERITGLGNKPLEAVAIYHIEANKIKKVYFIQ